MAGSRDRKRRMAAKGMADMSQPIIMSNAPDEMVDDKEERLAELEALIPWMKSYAEGLGDKIKELKGELAAVKLDVKSVAISIPEPANPVAMFAADENEDGGNGAEDYAFGCTLDGDTVHVETGKILIEGHGELEIVAANYAISTGYQYPTVVYDIANNTAVIQVLPTFSSMAAGVVYVPLVRIKDKAFDSPGYILWDRNILMSTSILFG